MTENTEMFNQQDNGVQLFHSTKFGNLRVIALDGDPWFVAADVCDALEISNPSDAIKRLDEDERARFNLGRQGEANVVSFPGVLSMILGSRKPEAREYKRWVTHEVLPSIHKTGGYMAVKPEETPEQTMARALLMADDTIKRQSAELVELRPKALLAEAVVEPSPVAYTVTEATRYLVNIASGVRRQDVFDILRATGMMCKGSTAPTRLGIDTGRMVALAGEYRDKDTGEIRAGRQRGKITCKGLAFLTEHVAGKVA